MSAPIGIGAFSDNVHHFVHCALADSTRRSYGAALARYQEYCSSHSLSPSPADLTAATAAGWLAELGAASSLSSATIRTYSSALSTWFVEGTLSDALNPMESVAVQRVLKGITRDHHAAEAEARAARPTSIEATPSLLASLEVFARPAGCGPPEFMRWAAANTATYALLRPSELLGSAQHRDRALRAEQIAFFMGVDSSIPCKLLPPGSHVDDHCFPDRFTIALGATKADQLGNNAPVPVAAAPAVRALWRWMHIRRDLGPAASDPLFCIPSCAPLSCTELTAKMESWLTQFGVIAPVVKGRTFRRGGASGLMAAGAARGDVAKAGRWRTQAMAERYASAASMQARAVEVSRGMAPH